MPTPQKQGEVITPRRTGGWRYFASCGLLMLPILAWNAAFTRFLPPAFEATVFQENIPVLVNLGENVSRFAVFVLPFLMPLDLSSMRQYRRLALFVAGTVLYFGVWIPLMLAPHSAWSTSLIGFAAPAYTPLLWLISLSLLGRELYWSTPYRPWLYMVLSVVLVAFHLTHVILIYNRSAMSNF